MRTCAAGGGEHEGCWIVSGAHILRSCACKGCTFVSGGHRGQARVERTSCSLWQRLAAAAAQQHEQQAGAQAHAPHTC
jgi:hypothetical protein